MILWAPPTRPLARQQRASGAPLVVLLIAAARPAAAETRWPLSLDDCLKLAVEASPDLALLQAAQFGAEKRLQAERGLFYPTLELSSAGRGDRQPTRFRFEGDNAVFASRGFDYAAGISGRVPTGLQYRLALRSDVMWTDQSAAVLSRQHENTALLELTQPILSGWGWDNNLVPIRVARADRERVEASAEAALIELVLTVVRDYWELVARSAQREVAREGLQLAESLRQAAGLRAKAGKLADVDLVEADSAVASRRQALILAEEATLDAEQALLSSLCARRGKGRAACLLERRVVASDKLELVASDEEAAMTQLVQRALANRPEMRQSGLAQRVRALELKAAANRAWPKVDLYGRFELISLQGKPSAITGERYPDLRGDHLDAWRQVFTAEFPTFQLGLTVQLPLSSAVRRRELNQARVEMRQAEVERQRVAARVALQVRGAFLRLRVQHERAEASASAERLSQRHLDAAEKRFRGGWSTSFDVLRAQLSLVEARKEAIEARKDAVVATAVLAAATGQILSRYNIQLVDSQAGATARRGD